MGKLVVFLGGFDRGGRGGGGLMETSLKEKDIQPNESMHGLK